MFRASATTQPLPPRVTHADHDAIVGALANELTAALERAAGDEKKLLDTVVLFVRRVHVARVPHGWIPEIFGVSIARSTLAPGEREAVFRMFPRCGEFFPPPVDNQGEPRRWWRWHRLPVTRTRDIGLRCI
jgi:hypothetical protein